jgi:hypothetical protein
MLCDGAPPIHDQMWVVSSGLGGDGFEMGYVEVAKRGASSEGIVTFLDLDVEVERHPEKFICTTKAVRGFHEPAIILSPYSF